MHFSSAADAERIGTVRVANAQRHIPQKFLVQPLAQLPRRDEFSLFPRERAIVDREGHLHRGFLNFDELDGFHLGRLAHGVPDIQSVDPRKHDDVARLRGGNGHPFQPFDLIEVGYLAVSAHLIIRVIADGHGLVGANDAPFDAPYPDAPDKLVIIDTGNEKLPRSLRVHIHGRNMR